MQAIITTYHGPTNFRGPRIHAKCDAKSLWMPCEDGLNLDQNHAEAASRIMREMGWDDHHDLVSGALPTGQYVHVMTKGIRLAAQVMNWAQTPGEHGGNPHCKDFVKTAERILESEV